LVFRGSSEYLFHFFDKYFIGNGAQGTGEIIITYSFVFVILLPVDEQIFPQSR